MTILEGKHLHKRFDRREHRIDALTDVSFSLKKGEILGVVGESGCGKSTLLKLISGLEPADGGALWLKGQPLGTKRSKDEYRAMQMIFQDAVGSFHPRRTIRASLESAVKTLLGPQAKVDPEALSAMVGLDAGLLDRYPGNLSGGQCQRFAIARAMAVEPEILLCDEVTSALDVSTQAQILRLLERLCRERSMSAVFVSHDLAVVSCICDRVLVMRGGAVVEEGPVRTLLERPEDPYTQQLLASVLQ